MKRAHSCLHIVILGTDPLSCLFSYWWQDLTIFLGYETRIKDILLFSVAHASPKLTHC